MRISQYISSEQAPRGLSAPMQSGASPLGQGLQQVGGGVAGIAADVLAKQRSLRDRTKLTQGIAELQSTATADLMAAQRAAPIGAADFTKNYLEGYDKRVAAMSESMPSAEARLAFTDRAATYRASLMGDAMAFEAQSAGKARASEVESALNLSTNTVLSAPGQYETIRADMLAGIDALAGVLPAQAVADLHQTADAQLAYARVRGVIERNPSAALAELNSGELDARLKPNDKAALINTAQTEITRRANEAKQRRREADVAYLAGFEDTVAYLEAGGTSPDPRFAPDALVSRFGDERGAELAKQIERASAFGQVVVSVNGATPDELADMLEREAADLATPTDFRTEARELTALQQAVAARNKALADDPAMFTLQNAPGVREAYDAMRAVESDPRAAPTDLAKATRSYALAARAEQDRLGLRSDQVRILPKGYADVVAAQFMSQAQGGENAASMVEGLAAQWGEAWPAVYSELSEGLPPAALVIGSGMSPAAGAALAEAAAIGRTEMLKGLPPTAGKEVRDALATEMAPFFETLSFQMGGQKTMAVFSDAAELLALRYMGTGMDAARGARRAFNETVAGKYSFVGSYRVPIRYDPVSVENGAEQFIEQWAGEGVDAPVSLTGLSDDEARAAYLSAVKADHIWVTAPNEDGLILLDGTESAVTIGDQPLFVPWAELVRLSKVSGNSVSSFSELPR